ncbi:DMT family transporter [Treponema pedis]|uniref:DMT family transporter n=1 Tax=Treponema pedis TaxID=409322 RepID=UPI000401FA1E|nr:DMT family transporter [Treponema pedis]
MRFTAKQKGILFLVLSAFFFALMNFFAKLSGDLPSLQKVFFRNLIAAHVSFFVLLRSKEKFKFNKKNLPVLFMRMFFGTLGVLGNFYAFDNLVLADASILAKLAPFFVIIFSFLFLKEKIKPYQAAAVIIAFSASLLVIKPILGGNAHITAAIIGAAGGMMAGAAYTCVRYLSLNGERSPFIVFFFSFFSSVLLLPLFIIFFKPMSIIQLVILLFASLAGTAAQFCVTAAYSYAPARSISIFDYTQIIFAAVLGFIAFGELPDILSCTGFAIIFAVAVFMFKHKEI